MRIEPEKFREWFTNSFDAESVVFQFSDRTSCVACGNRLSVSQSSITKVLSLLLAVNDYENSEIEREGTERSNLLTVRNSERVKILAAFNQ